VVGGKAEVADDSACDRRAPLSTSTDVSSCFFGEQDRCEKIQALRKTVVRLRCDRSCTPGRTRATLSPGRLWFGSSRVGIVASWRGCFRPRKEDLPARSNRRRRQRLTWRTGRGRWATERCSPDDADRSRLLQLRFSESATAACVCKQWQAVMYCRVRRERGLGRVVRLE
jgi:hypothetical protein